MASYSLYFAFPQDQTHDFNDGQGPVPAYCATAESVTRCVRKTSGQIKIIGSITGPDRDIVHYSTQSEAIMRWARQSPYFVARTPIELNVIIMLDMRQMLIDNSIAIPALMAARLKVINKTTCVYYYENDEVMGPITPSAWDAAGRPEVFLMYRCHEFISHEPEELLQ